jgi:tetratricopeptide (TPR) repeat protein
MRRNVGDTKVTLPPTRPLGQPARDASPTSGDTELDAEASAKPGQSFGRFEIRDVLGSGGMGTVFEARDPTLDRVVALKLLHPELATRSERHVLREAQSLAKLSHPNVVQVFEAGIAEDRPFIAMELVRGKTLAQWQGSPHGWRECVSVYLQAGRGLAAAHARALVHRDFKPSNCILDEDGRVRVLDFGLARSLDAAVVNEARASFEPEVHTQRGIDVQSHERGAPGTLGYMPLEQLWGQPLDAKSDQFSFCVSLFEALHGRRPFTGESVDALVTAMVDGALDMPPEPVKIPSRLRRLLVRGLKAAPAARWPAMEDVLRELEQLSSTSRGRRSAWAYGGLGGSCLVLMAGGGWWWTRPPLCEGPPVELEDAWGVTLRARVSAAIEHADVEVSPEILPRLDAYAHAWIAARGAACEAERQALADEATAATRRQCLVEGHEALGEVALMLGEGEDDVLMRASSWVDDLPDLGRCEEIERFAPQRPLPDGLELADRVRALRLRRALALASHLAGHHEAALAILDPAIADATTLGFVPLLAELELLRGNVWVEHGRYDEAEHDLEQAYSQAMEHEHQHVALEAAIGLAYVMGDLREQHDVGFKWGLTAEALARQPWSNPGRLAGAMDIMGNVLYEQGRYSLAFERYEQALELRDRIEPDNALEPSTLSNMGLVRYEQGHYEEALPLVLEVLERREAELEPMHPAIAVSLISLGTTLHRLGRHAEALACYEQALEIRESSLGPGHPGMVIVLNELGRLWMDMGEPARALQAHQRALAIGAASLDPIHSHLADAWLGLGQVLVAHGQLDAATRHLGRGKEMLEQAVGPRHVHVGAALTALGRIEHEAGEREAARDHLERAIDIFTNAEAPPALLAAARFGLAQVRWSSPGERDTAVALAEQAQGVYVELGEPTRSEAEAVRAWLATHGSG